MREIVLDTETTGLDPFTGDRLVEIGCVELENSLPTGDTFHVYLNPQRDMPDEAFRIHGLSGDFLASKPLFESVVDSFLSFIGTSKLVIHNAEFDMKFLNNELKLAGKAVLSKERVIDTLAIARRKHPGSPNSLDALCSRYKIDNSRRTKHGALMDSEILAEVYLELCGGRQTVLSLKQEAPKKIKLELVEIASERPNLLSNRMDEKTESAHQSMREDIGEKAVWRHYIK
jgi:DNA polymerase III subunit epsilon